MSQKRRDPSKERGIWSSIIPTAHLSNTLYFNENDQQEETTEQPSEARAWSTYQASNLENVLGEGPTRQQKLLLTGESSGEYRPYKEDSRGVENILAFIDQRRPHRIKKYRITWRTFIGTMSGFEHVYQRQDLERDYGIFFYAFVFMDSVFRGIAQVMFANNPLSGIIITVGLFIGNWELACYGLLGTCVSTLTAHILGFTYNSIRAGLYGYNGCLTAMGIAYFTFSQSPQMIGPIIIMCMFSTIFAMAISKILVQRLELSPFTFSFQICSWIWLLGALKFRYFFVNGNILSPHLLTTFTDKPNLENVSYSVYSVQDNFVGFFTSISQVYFIENPYTGAIIIIGVSICSRILAFFAVFGAVTSQLAAAYALGLPAASIHSGLWGFNSVLTCQALGGMFFVLYGFRIWLVTLYASIMTVLLQAAVAAFLSPAGMPTFTFPFTVICWIFCLIAGSKNLIAVKLTAVSIPEDHYRRYRLSQLVRSQFKFISHLTHLSAAHDQDITWQELAKINEIFVPTLMCSYVFHDDMNSLKRLVRQHVNPQATDQNSRSPLHISAAQGNVKMTKWLVENLQVNINIVDKFESTPLLEALWNGHFHLLSYLYTRGARLPASRSKELAFYLNAFVYEGNLDAAQCLLSCGLNPNTGDHEGRNSLHMAVISNQFDLVCYLIEEFPMWLEIPDYFRQTAIDYASRLPDPKIADFLMEKQTKSAVPLKTSVKTTKLMEVVVGKALENKKVLSSDEKRYEKSTDLDESLLPTLFYMIASRENMKLIENFLDEFPQINPIEHVDYDFRSAAHVAAAEGRLEVIEFLSRQCSSVEFAKMMNREDRWNLSPLDEAYRNRHTDVCEFVMAQLSANSDSFLLTTYQPKETVFDNSAALQLLRKWNKIFLICTLATSGAAERIDALYCRGYFLARELYADYHGRTAMHFAAANGHLNVIKLLIRYRPQDVLHTDRWGNYPIDEARQKKHNEIADALIRSMRDDQT